ncbi:MAG: efflux RND transporter periplasmic adaptor subunit [Kofleriaceae bacterium]|nr:efflux RND transporter periplasmic adaptor subunit [Myxococcales bacterium]MCB9562865.1 efflux RND transporter periplasmic adaptor subunit [Kofleriaceae bacterium]MCB9572758.1 efflux RND transporter periplasmic adaptor subunit [Kofleriaceae bacterium]
MRFLRRPLVWIAAAVVIAGAVVLLLRARGPVVRTCVVIRQDLEQHLVASGRVRVPTRVQIAAQTAGLVVAVGAVEGQHVAAGDLLVQLDDGAERAAVAQAEAAVSQAKARVDQLRRVGAIVASEALREAESNLARAQADLERTRSLVEQHAAPAVDLEHAQRAVDIAQARKNAADAQQAAAAPAGADSRVALTALLQAQAQLAGAKVRLEQTRIVALHDGDVLTRSVEPGDVVQPSRTLMVLAADAEVQLVFQADERNLAWLAVGQAARASADAYPQEVFDATVSYIAPSIDPQRGSVEVRLAVPAPPAHLRPEMTVSIDLTVATRADVLTVRSAAVRDAASSRPYVLTVEDGRVARHDVQLGIRGDGATELVGGVAEGAEVIIPDGQRLEVGARVRPERD